MNRILLVARRDYRQVVATRGFKILLLIVPLMIGISAFATSQLRPPPSVAPKANLIAAICLLPFGPVRLMAGPASNLVTAVGSNSGVSCWGPNKVTKQGPTRVIGGESMWGNLL